MEFAILGPLEVRHDGRIVPIPGRHAPKLLAMLLLNAGRLVTVPRLVETLWGEDPPATARRQVQNVMAALRRALPVPEVIEAVPGGYRIVLDGHDLDLHEFDRLRAAARDAGPRQAARLLTAALRLWRGAALAGPSGGAIEAAVVKLDEDRFAAVAERVERDFELGEYDDAVPRLRDLVEAHPYRQRLSGLLMRALWHTGDTADAQGVYERLRERLADDLGLDPDPELTRLHAAIRRGAPDKEPSGPAQRGPVPAQLPGAPSTFTGRREHLARLDELLERGADAAVVSAIAGMGGAGKIALALHWGHSVRDRFPDGQLYVNLRGYDEAEPVAPIDALGRFLVALGQPSANLPSDVESAAALFRSLVESRRMLVVLDNARTAAQVRPLLPGGAGNFALVTSRDRMAAVDGDEAIRLDTLSPDESLELLAKVVGTERTAAESRAALRIVELCGRLPLALRIAGANLAARPETSLAGFAETLAGPDRLEHLAVDGEHWVSVARALELSLAGLDPRCRGLIAKLALVPGEDFGAELATHLSETTGPRARELLDRLEAAHLVEQPVPHRYRLHDLTGEFVRHRARLPQADVDRFRSLFIGWHHARRRSIPGGEAGNVLAAFNAWPDHAEVWKLATMFSMFCGTEVTADRLLRLCERALDTVDSGEEPVGYGYLLMEAASINRTLGRRQTAVTLAENAVELVTRDGPGDDDGRFRANLAIMTMEVGQFERAETLMRAARGAALAASNPTNILACSSTLASICRKVGKYAEAERLLESVIDNPELPAPPAFAAIATAELGAVRLDTGRHTDALAAMDDALARFPDASNVRSTAVIRIARAGILRRTGAYDAARTELLDVLELASEAGLDGPQQTARMELARVFSDTGDQEAAARLLDEIGPPDVDEPDTELVAESARLRCVVLNRMGRFSRAVGFGRTARDRNADMSNRLRLAQSLVALATAYDGVGDTAEAAACRRRAREIFARLGVPEAG